MPHTPWDMLKLFSDRVRLESASDMASLQLHESIVSAAALDSAYFMSSELFCKISTLLGEKEYLFVHRYDTLLSAETNESSRFRTIDLQSHEWKSEFLAETDTYDAITYNFRNGLVLPSSMKWCAICLVQCDIALIFAFGGNETIIERIKYLGYPREVALGLLSSCIDKESLAKVGVRIG